MATDIIIRKQKIKVKTSSEGDALQVRRQLNDQLQYDLIKIFETEFPDTLGQDEYLTINNICIDLGTVSADVFEQHFIQLVSAKLKAELQKTFAGYTKSSKQEKSTKSSGNESTVSPTNNKQQHETHALLYFLEHGIYPWWYKREQQQSPGELLNNLPEAAFNSLLLKILSIKNYRLAKVSDIIIERLFIHLKDAQYKYFIQRFLSLLNSVTLQNNIDSLLSQQEELLKSLTVTKQEFYKRLFQLLTDRDINNPAGTIHTFISRLQESLSPVSDDADTKQTPSNSNKPSPQKEPVVSEIEEEGIYISNAGLILLHPFLASFFGHLGLFTEQQQFITITHQQKATVLLFYMQSFNEVYEEWNMAFNKIICGLAIEDVLPAGIYITEEEKGECRTLLQAVANYWETLKGASAEALQNTFLLREGKMTRKETHWLLQVERTGADILLNKLPWSFGTVKLPWLQQMIYTEW